MSRPPLEVADLIRAAGAALIERNRQWIRWSHVKVLLAIARCRTAALGGHIDECTRCGHRASISYNSCRNRHCPKCQTAAREQWIAGRRRELLPTRYMHVVFTLPSRLAPLVLQNKKVIYDLLFRTSAETLLEVARDPRLLGAEIGFFSVLHSWSQQFRTHRDDLGLHQFDSPASGRPRTSQSSVKSAPVVAKIARPEDCSAIPTSPEPLSAMSACDWALMRTMPRQPW